MSRLTAMRVVAWLLVVTGIGFSLFTIVFGLVGPNQEIHAVHNAIVVSLIAVLTVPALIVVARRPADATPELLVLLGLAVAGAVAMLISLTADPVILPVLVLIVVLWVLAPSRSGGVPPGRWSVPMLALVIGAAVVLVPYGLDNAALQRTDASSDHARFFHWVESAFHVAGILVLGAFAAWRPAGYRIATWSAGLGLVVLGVASAVFPGFASALGAPWSWVVALGGLALIAVGEWERGRSVRPPRQPLPA